MLEYEGEWLLGDACSNLFDGERTVGEGADAVRLRGVALRDGEVKAPIGVLVHAEAHGHCTVGRMLKQPAWPVR